MVHNDMNVIGFDFDGTLVKRGTTSALPGVRARLASLSNNTRIFVATNQAGPTCRIATGNVKYPTAQQVAMTLCEGLDAVGRWPELLLVAVYAREGEDWEQATDDAADQLHDALRSMLPPSVNLAVDISPACSKPRAGMLVLAAERFHVRRHTLIYVGDKDIDRLTAASAKTHFMDAAAWRRGEEIQYLAVRAHRE